MTSIPELWKITTIAGVFMPESPSEESAPDEGNDSGSPRNDGQTNKPDGQNTKEGNTNNNANSKSGDVEDSPNEDADNKRSSQPQTAKKPLKERSAKFKMEPCPPTDQLVIVIYSDSGKTDQLPLKSDKPDLFQSGQHDEFLVSTIYARNIYFI